MKKIILAIVAICVTASIPAFAQGKKQAEKFDPETAFLLDLHNRYNPEIYPGKNKENWEKNVENYINDKKAKESAKEHKQQQLTMYQKAEAAMLSVSDDAKQFYANLIKQNDTQKVLKYVSTVNPNLKELPAIKYFILRETVLRHGFNIEGTLDTAQNFIVGETASKDNYVYQFAKDIEAKCFQSNPKPFAHLKNAKTQVK